MPSAAQGSGSGQPVPGGCCLPLGSWLPGADATWVRKGHLSPESWRAWLFQSLWRPLPLTWQPGPTPRLRIALPCDLGSPTPRGAGTARRSVPSRQQLLCHRSGLDLTDGDPGLSLRPPVKAWAPPLRLHTYLPRKQKDNRGQQGKPPCCSAVSRGTHSLKASWQGVLSPLLCLGKDPAVFWLL